MRPAPRARPLFGFLFGTLALVIGLGPTGCGKSSKEPGQFALRDGRAKDAVQKIAAPKDTAPKDMAFKDRHMAKDRNETEKSGLTHESYNRVVDNPFHFAQ